MEDLMNNVFVFFVYLRAPRHFAYFSLRCRHQWTENFKTNESSVNPRARGSFFLHAIFEDLWRILWMTKKTFRLPWGATAFRIFLRCMHRNTEKNKTKQILYRSSSPRIPFLAHEFWGSMENVLNAKFCFLQLPRGVRPSRRTHMKWYDSDSVRTSKNSDLLIYRGFGLPFLRVEVGR